MIFLLRKDFKYISWETHAKSNNVFKEINHNL